MWKEVVIVFLKVLFWHLLRETEENHKSLVRIASLWTEN